VFDVGIVAFPLANYILGLEAEREQKGNKKR
jgi:hypothetical protein